MNRRRFCATGIPAAVGALLPLLAHRVYGGGTTSLSGKNGMKTGYYYDDICLGYELEPLHPESPERLMAIREIMNSSGLMNHVTPLEPLADPMPWIGKIHSARHIASVQSMDSIGKIATAAVAGVLGAVSAVCKGEVRNAFCAIRPPGHHAQNTGREEGFCFYSNVAVAARYAQETFKTSKVLIVDWDYHHGNGTEGFFYEDPSVMYFSTHNWHAYPGTGNPGRTGAGAAKGNTINVHLGSGSCDKEIVDAFKTRLVPKARAFRPDIILISAGFDSRKDDRLGTFGVTDKGFVELTHIVMDLAHATARDRVVSVLEGGYDPQGLAMATAAHVKALLGYDPA